MKFKSYVKRKTNIQYVTSALVLWFFFNQNYFDVFGQCQFAVVHNNANDQCLYATENVVWSKTGLSAGLTANSYDIDKTGGSAGWNTGAVSVNTVKNNGWATNTITDISSKAWAFGLSTSDGGATNSSIQYRFETRADGSVDIYESSQWRKNISGIANGKIFKIAIENSVVKYYYDGALQYVSAVTPTLPLIVDVSLNSSGANLRSVQVTNGSDGSFTATAPAADLGTSPSYKWYLGGTFTGVTTSTYTNTSLTTGNQIYCEITPGTGGCSATAVNSNTVSFQIQPPSLFGDYYISSTAAVQACLAAEEQVLKFSKTNVSVSGNSVKKNYGVTSGSWDAGASSTVKVYNNGYVETTIAEIDKTRAFGLSSSDANLNINSIQFGIFLRADNHYEIYESSSSAVYTPSPNTYGTNDVFRIAVEDGVVKYYQNGTLVYISSGTPAASLLVDISLQDMDATINNIRISNGSTGAFTATASVTGSSPSYNWFVNGTPGGSGSTYSNTLLQDADVVKCTIDPGLVGCTTSPTIAISSKNYGGTFYIYNSPVTIACAATEEQVQFTSLWNVTTSANNVTKAQGGSGFWNAGATSLNKVYDNGYVETTALETTTTRAFGLSSASLTIVHSSNADRYIQYSIQLSGTQYYVFEYNSSGTLTYWNSFGTYGTGDVFKILVDNGTVRYYRGNTNFYSSSVAPSLPMVVNTALNTNGATLRNVVVSNGCSGVFNAVATYAGTSPTYQWTVGGTPVQTGTSPTYSSSDLQTGAIVVCNITPDIAGCGSLAPQSSNQITVKYVGGSTSPTTTWTGANSTAWGNALNWSNGRPGGSTKVVIPSTTNSPTLSADAGVYDITIQSGATLNASANLTVFDAWSNQGTFNPGTSKVYLKNCTSNSNSVSAPASGNTFYDLEIDNTNGASISGSQTISHDLKFTNGIISSSASSDKIVINDNATITGASSSKYVNGKIKKIGNDAFSFPVGKKTTSPAGSFYRPISISAPALVTDAFEAEYFKTVQTAGGPSTWPAELWTISGCEYWNLARTAGSSQPAVTLSWVSLECNQANYVTDMSQLVVVGFDGSNWKNWGNNQPLISGSPASGTITSNVSISSFGPFALGSLVMGNPLPIELTRFESQKLSYGVQLKWTTASEVNNDFFELEKSLTGNDFKPISRISGAGTSSHINAYDYIDRKPSKGRNYYRLSQVDFNGVSKHSEVLYVDFEKNIELIAFPNPVKRGEVVEIISPGERLSIIDPVSAKVIRNLEGANVIETNTLSPGMYLIVDEYANKFQLVVL